ncbi:OmpA family protein [Piscinibacter sakaiensis]|uniref:OmpA family protein n=1 Tax=Piscinibacter sakaiensis TaxID=1547922 RepID=UPI003AAD015D
MNRLLIALLGGLVAALVPLHAHAQDVILKGSQVTESALIDALAVEGPQGPAGAKTRGFAAARPSSPGTPAPKPGPGKASLLITFETNSSELSSETMATLDVLARALQSDTLAGFTFKVEGHADPRGDAAQNLLLSQQRAESVARYLVNKHAILPERLDPVGKGSSELMNRNRIDAPENRRVTIVTVKG